MSLCMAWGWGVGLFCLAGRDPAIANCSKEAAENPLLPSWVHVGWMSLPMAPSSSTERTGAMASAAGSVQLLRD